MRGAVDAVPFTLDIETGADATLSASILRMTAGVGAGIAEGMHLASVHKSHHRQGVPAPPASLCILAGR